MAAKKLAETLQTQASEEARRKQAEVASAVAIAEAFDTFNYDGTAPWLVSGNQKPNYRGDVGRISFRDVLPDETLRLMETFPAVPSAIFRARCGTSHRPLSHAPGDVQSQISTDGYELNLSGGEGYQSANFEWSAVLADGVQVAISVEPAKNLYGVMPRIQPGRAARYPDGKVIRYTSPDSLIFPVNPGAGFDHIRYGRGSENALQTFLVYGTAGGEGLRGLVRAMADHCETKNVNGRAAYEKQKAAISSASPGADDIARQAELCADAYARESLRAGTLRQYAALHTAAGLADQELAKQHWLCYCADREKVPADCPVQRSEYETYFSHYTWACAFLFRAGLLDDAENSPRNDGKPYRYGSAWV